MNTYALNHTSALKMSTAIKSFWQWLLTAPADNINPIRMPAPTAYKRTLPSSQTRKPHTRVLARSTLASGSQRPLRVLRVLESGSPANNGRLRISGRMADVCAELDRLASMEARLH